MLAVLVVHLPLLVIRVYLYDFLIALSRLLELSILMKGLGEVVVGSKRVLLVGVSTEKLLIEFNGLLSSLCIEKIIGLF